MTIDSYTRSVPKDICLRQQASDPRAKGFLRIARTIEANSLNWQVRVIKTIGSTADLREAVEALEAINNRIKGAR
jgi:hypothetical protein